MAERLVEWTIEETFLRSMLQRAADGEGVDAILAEVYANAEHTEGHEET